MTQELYKGYMQSLLIFLPISKNYLLLRTLIYHLLPMIVFGSINTLLQKPIPFNITPCYIHHFLICCILYSIMMYSLLTFSLSHQKRNDETLTQLFPFFMFHSRTSSGCRRQVTDVEVSILHLMHDGLIISLT